MLGRMTCTSLRALVLPRSRATALLFATSLVGTACKDDRNADDAADDSSTTDGTSSTASSGMTSGNPGSATASSATSASSVTSASATGNPTATSNDTMTTQGSADSTGEPATECDFGESFDADGSAWPDTWINAGGVATADVQGGRGRLSPITSNYSLARMYAPADCTNADISFTFEFSDAASQGIGVYVRQNGQYLQQTDPPGEGYAVFIEAFRNPVGIGVWHELGGVETVIGAVESYPISSGVRYRARLRVTQHDATTTRLQARIWHDGEAEPDVWNVERDDQSTPLQGIGGGIAIDAWSSLTNGSAAMLLVDDIVMTQAQ